MVNTDQTFIINVSYRARGLHTVRRQQLIHFIENTKTYFTKHGVPFKIVISEQNNDKIIEHT